MNIGKISPEILEEIVLNPINKNLCKRKEIIICPSTGEDCSALDLNNEYCVLSADPITGAEKNAGYIAVHVNCNDIAASGAEPIGILLTLLLPEYSEKELLKQIIDDVSRAAKELNIGILGGHTEVTAAVNKPIISIAVIGKSKNKKFISTGGAKENQDIVMTKWAGLEGTVIIASDKERELKNKNVKSDIINNSKNMSDFLSVVEEAKIAFDYGATAMHDVTEGGIFGAVWEVAECSKIGVKVFADKIPVKDETKEICSAAGISPYRLISSGSLMIACDDGYKLSNILKDKGINAEVIGKFIGKEKFVVENGQQKILEQPQSDELYKALNGLY